MSNSEIALLRNRSKATIEAHRAHFMHKLGVHTVIDLIKRAADMGLVDLKEKPQSPK